MSRTRMFGRLVKKDPRDNKYKLRRRVSQRRVRTWNDNYAFIDQDQKSSCVGHAWAHWLLNYPFRQYMDPDFIYDVARFYDEYKGENYDGTSVRAGAKVLQLSGCIKEYRWATSVPVMVSTLLELGPMVVGLNWYEGMSNPDKQGLMSVAGACEGGHAFLLTGVDTLRERFRMKNSYGRSWGLAGRGYLTFKDMRRLPSEDGEACIAFESEPFKNLKRKVA